MHLSPFSVIARFIRATKFSRNKMGCPDPSQKAQDRAMTVFGFELK
jgi:hypothetical protein